jgi:gentisate 1,2-dioxygenase
MPAAADGSRRLRYTNPLTGGATMATLDCDVLEIPRGASTRATRTNGNEVCVVVEGEGESTVGNSTLSWGPRDIFSVPRGVWSSHRARSAKARLFRVNDHEMLKRLDMFRAETR